LFATRLSKEVRKIRKLLMVPALTIGVPPGAKEPSLEALRSWMPVNAAVRRR
jgi:hypothetical protein